MTAQDRGTHWSAETSARAWSSGCAVPGRRARSRCARIFDSLAPQAEISWPVFRAVRDAWAGRIDLQASSIMQMDAFAEPQGERLADIVADRAAYWAASRA